MADLAKKKPAGCQPNARLVDTMTLHRTLGASSALVVACALLTQAQQPVFRGSVEMVSVDVRVVDRNGAPVRDLVASDFTVTEDGKPQAIALFGVIDYGRLDNEPEGRPPSSKPSRAPDGTDRIFAILLGRGRLQGPSKGFDALVDFVNNQTLPRDRFAVIAYDRITDLTSDRAATIRLLQTYRAHHEEIEALFAHWFSGLTDFLGDGKSPPRLTELIETLFSVPGLPPSGHFATADSRIAGRTSSPTPDDVNQQERSSFIYSAAARDDFERLLGGIDHLRALEGEKHMILVTPNGLLGLKRGHAERIANSAADARVTLSIIHTGGLPTSWTQTGTTRIFEGPSWDDRWAIADSKTIAAQTGGVTSIYDYAAPTLRRIEEGSRVRYTIGYTPSKPSGTGAFRRIVVTVNRPGVTVLFRHGYFDKPDRALTKRDDRANARITAAQLYRLPVDDVRLSVTATLIKEGADKGKVRAEIRVASGAIAFDRVDGRELAMIDVGVFVGDGPRQIGESRKRVDLKLTPENFLAVQRDGLQFTTTVAITAGTPRRVKAVVYDFVADRLGSVVAEVR